MPVRRTLHRCVTAFSVVLALLFSQLALANYVCPGSVDALAMAEMMVAGTPCEGMDAAQPALCHQSAAGAPQSVATINVAAPFLPTAVQVRVVPIVADAPIALASRFAATAEAHPPPDPLFLATLRLRV